MQKTSSVNVQKPDSTVSRRKEKTGTSSPPNAANSLPVAYDWSSVTRSAESQECQTLRVQRPGSRLLTFETKNMTFSLSDALELPYAEAYLSPTTSSPGTEKGVNFYPPGRDCTEPCQKVACGPGTSFKSKLLGQFGKLSCSLRIFKRTLILD
jgi:hypothetical protein